MPRIGLGMVAVGLLVLITFYHAHLPVNMATAGAVKAEDNL